jgi:ferredoxin
MVDTEFIAPGEKIPIQAPIVDLELCIGCGICENRCPVEDEPGIYCTNYGESRSEKNSYSVPPPA